MPICMLVRMGVANVDKRLYSIVDILVERRISGQKFCIVLYCTFRSYNDDRMQYLGFFLLLFLFTSSLFIIIVSVDV